MYIETVFSWVEAAKVQSIARAKNSMRISPLKSNI
jgi:hypothetical protein